MPAAWEAAPLVGSSDAAPAWQSAPLVGPPASSAEIDPYSQQPHDPATMAKDTAPLGSIPIFPAPAPGALRRVGEAAAEGWRGSPASVLTSEAQTAAEQSNDPLTRFVVAPGALIAGTAMAGANALFRGGQQFVQEAVSPISPQLGRDVAALPEAFAGDPHAVAGGPSEVRGAQEAPPGPKFVQEYYGEGTRQNPLAAKPQGPAPAFVPPDAVRPPAQLVPAPTPAEPPAFVPPTRAANTNLPPASATPPTGDHAAWLGGLSQDVQEVLRQNGRTSLSAAATPDAAAAMSPAAVKANRRMSELGEIMAPPELGENNITYVDGSNPTKAERLGDAKTSQLETVLRQRNPNQFDQQLAANSAARVRKFDDLAGSDAQLANLNDRQAVAAQADTAKIVQSAKPANLQPAAEYIDNLLNDPRIKERDDLVKVLQPLRDALYDDNGQLKTDPMAVWGMHDNLMNKLAKAKDPLNATGAEKFAFGQLNEFKKVVDGVMNNATGGAFQTFLDNQASFFQQKNAMEVLQKFRTGMVDAKTGNIYADKFHRWVADLAVRRGKPGVDPAMDIPDSTMRGLIDIDNDLKRASRIDFGKARGSPTNLFFEVAKAAGLAGAHAIAGMTTGGVGNFVLQQAIPGITNWKLNRLTQQHLAPPEGGYRPNPMTATGPP